MKRLFTMLALLALLVAPALAQSGSGKAPAKPVAGGAGLLE